MTPDAPRYRISYGQDPTDLLSWGEATEETLGDPASGVGGTSTFGYTTSGLPSNLIDPSDPIVSRTTLTDRNGNRTYYDFNAGNMPSRVEVLANRSKSSLQASSFVTWTKFNPQGQEVLVVLPEGDSIGYLRETGGVPGVSSEYVQRRGLLLAETRYPGNTLGGPKVSGTGTLVRFVTVGPLTVPDTGSVD